MLTLGRNRVRKVRTKAITLPTLRTVVKDWRASFRQIFDFDLSVGTISEIMFSIRKDKKNKLAKRQFKSQFLNVLLLFTSDDFASLCLSV